jgi:hypothetical protein
MSAPRVDSSHSCWTTDYLLAHCEHYRVESADGPIGYVERVIRSADGRVPLRLAVRACGAEGSLMVAIEDLLELHPEGERIVVRRPSRERTSPEPRRAAAPKPTAQRPRRDGRSHAGLTVS